VDAGVARHLGAVFVSVSVSSCHDETIREVAEGNVSANVDVSGTSDGRVRVHRPRHPSQRDAPRSSERVWPAKIKVT
jgi:hypothetical protein